ncbi:MAG: hypothetical protein K6T85_17015, partial [Gorillibacterium sp.]|nr:hypothetical protein [Gorillibacterium sp.]
MSVKVVQILLLFKMALILLLAGILVYTFSSGSVGSGMVKTLRDGLGEQFLTSDVNTLDALE